MNRAPGRAMACCVLALAFAACGDDDGAGGAGSFCSISERLEESAAIDLMFSGDLGTDEVKTRMETMVSDLSALRGAAPSEISADVELVTDGFTAIATYLKDNGYDPASIAEPGFESVVAEFDTPEFNAATETLDAYSEQNCTAGS